MTAASLSVLIAPLNEEETGLFLRKLWQLLAKQTERYCMGDSTSIPVETAQELFASLCFTLCFEMETSGLCARDLLEEDFWQILKKGQKHLREKVAKAKTRWENAETLAALAGEHQILEELHLLVAFFQRYDLYFFAHRTPWEMGIPLIGPAAEEGRGILYVEMYLKTLCGSLDSPAGPSGCQ